MARHAVAIKADCFLCSRLLTVAVVDISRGGCRIIAPRVHLGVGQTVMLRINGLELLSGTVRWCDVNYAGLEFQAPLDQTFIRQVRNIDRAWKVH